MLPLASARFTAAVSAVLLLALAPLFSAAQQPVPAEDAQAVREVIEAQIDAFRRDDAEAAFALATPGIRATFGSAAHFLAMVRGAYAAVYRPRSVLFETPLLVEGQLVQPVRLTDAEGRGWLALYPMERQPDGRWRTNGCQLSRLAGTQT
jgi:type II secretory pathway pseudopilin PulG